LSIACPAVRIDLQAIVSGAQHIPGAEAESWRNRCPRAFARRRESPNSFTEPGAIAARRAVTTSPAGGQRWAREFARRFKPDRQILHVRFHVMSPEGEVTPSY
jgi:hypothetical protein